MKILVGVTYYAPYVSGLSAVAKTLAEGLVAKGHEVVVLTARYSRLPLREEIKGVAVRRCWSPLRIGKAAVMPFLPFWAWWLVRRCDVVHCHLPQVEAFWLLLMAKLLRKKTLVTYQCDVKLTGLLGKMMEWSLLGSNFINCCLADQIVGSSKDYLQHSRVARFFSGKTKVINLPVRDFSSLATDFYFKKKLEGFGKKTKIGFVGRLAADKGVEFLLETIPLLNKQLDDVGIFLVGPDKPVGESSYRRKISKLVRENPRQIFSLGRLSGEELATFFRSADLLVLPSVNSTEAFGMVQVEAMLMGCPVVATNLPGVRVPVKETGMGLIVPIRNSRFLAKAVLKVLKDKKTYKKPKGAIKKLFNEKKSIAEYEQALRQGLNK